MPVRDIIEIDEDLCDGCGECISACVEGALQLIDGTAKLIRDSYCDGLAACIGHCPQGAITIIQREAEDFDEEAVAEHLAGGASFHPPLPVAQPSHGSGHGGCPGSRTMTFDRPEMAEGEGPVNQTSQLRQWPIQLHLVPPTAPFFQGADVLLAADCVAFSVGGFHQRFLHGKALAIACPKLDSQQEIYLEKLVAMIDQAGVASITVMVMEVPCCGGLVRMVQQAALRARRQVPITYRVVGVRGEILAEEDLPPASTAG
jgi:NAD-dependent dihydropyrimidine dehydrogenase PreA subunit